MKILVLGSGGREHAIVWKLRQSSAVEKIWCAPGNGGIANDAECFPLDLGDVKIAADLATRLGADLTIVGPELPLVLGIADEFARRGLVLLGPSREAAQLEGSKVFAKHFLERHGIPTARTYGIFESASDARAALKRASWPLVIKADGLCAGKGVVVASSAEEAEQFIERVLEKREFGDAGGQVLIEEALSGEELSYIILTDGKDFIAMAPARDHKRAFDGDTGPNTGGMGAYSTDDILPPALEKQIVESVVRPTLSALREDGIPYRGFLYAGLMLTSEGPKVLEFNCRLGDPETQAVLLRADFDFAQACLLAAQGQLNGFKARWSPAASICVVTASEGYPSNPVTGRVIEGLEDAASAGGAMAFHAGTRKEGHKYYTSGGRVLGVSARAASLEPARKAVYDAISRIRFAGSHYRKDIGGAGVKGNRVAVEAVNG
ncbi:MAG TPA: phosphoribosylamine--glycine ligase [Candidatus Sulfotelmatobacter sp.]|nr:phosphoribosylamine--glycine ligase [Candidatus Sulfotelmatobacter sp.]